MLRYVITCYENRKTTHTISMKKVSAVLVVILITIILSNGGLVVYADNVDFFCDCKHFAYNLSEHERRSDQFDLNEEINRYNRFGSIEDRCELLMRMLDAGISNQVAVEYLYPSIGEIISKMAKNLYIKPHDAQLKVDANSERVFFIKKEIIGRQIDVDKIYDDIIDRLLAGEDREIVVYTNSLYPEIVSEDYAKYTHLRSDYSTNITSSSPERKHNIKNALCAINNIVIAPNETFSFNKVVGRRTEDNGYRSAKIIVNNEFVDGVGGGVCQVSSTLYNAVLMAGLEIVEANKHSRQVSYVKSGFDAMVNFGSSDLKFINNTSEKITIITNYDNNTIRIRIFGEDMKDTRYVLTSEIIRTIDAGEEIRRDNEQEYLDKVRYDDEYFYLKPAIKGVEIKSYREKYLGGVLVDKQLLRYDKFKSQNAVKVYGVEKRDMTIQTILA